MDTCVAYIGDIISKVAHFTGSVLLHVNKYEAAVEHFIAVSLQMQHTVDTVCCPAACCDIIVVGNSWRDAKSS